LKCSPGILKQLLDEMQSRGGRQTHGAGQGVRDQRITADIQDCAGQHYTKEMQWGPCFLKENSPQKWLFWGGIVSIFCLLGRCLYHLSHTPAVNNVFYLTQCFPKIIIFIYNLHKYILDSFRSHRLSIPNPET
jgi:hypothetical protein